MTQKKQTIAITSELTYESIVSTIQCKTIFYTYAQYPYRDNIQNQKKQSIDVQAYLGQQQEVNMESAYTDVTTVYKNKYKKINESMDYIENISTDIQDHPSPTTDYKYFIYDKMNTTDRLLSEPKHNYSILIRPDRPKKLYVFTISTSFDRTFQKVQRLPVSRVINIAIETNYTYRG